MNPPSPAPDGTRRLTLWLGVLLGGTAAAAWRQPEPLPLAGTAWCLWAATASAYAIRAKECVSGKTPVAAPGRFARAGLGMAWLRGHLAKLGLWAGGGGAAVLLVSALAALRHPPIAHSIAWSLLLLGGAAFGSFLLTYERMRAAGSAPGWPAVTVRAIAQATNLLAALTGLWLLAERYSAAHLHAVWVAAFAAVLAAWIGETLLRAAARLYQPPRLWKNAPPIVAGWVLWPFFSREERTAWRPPATGDEPAIRLAEMWFLPTLRRLMLPLLAVVALLFWLGTALHEVPFGAAGLRSRFGRLAPEPLPPGLHLTWPAPFEEVALVPTDRLRRLVLGLQADTGKPILWDREHYLGEENQLVGGGEELLTISVPIYYRIADPLAYYRNVGDAETLVRDLARQQLLRLTLRRAAFAIMTTDRDALAAELHAGLQAELDRRATGVQVALVCLRDIHPAVQVAPAFQEVVSALEDREAFAHEGESYRADYLPRAQAAAYRQRADADTHFAQRHAAAAGEAASFLQLLASYQAGPAVFRARQGYAAFDDSLRGVKKLVVDEALRGRLPALVDARKALNPDFAPAPAPEKPALIPFLTGKPRAFDRAIEGYLEMGRGAIPAPPPAPPDPDFLLPAKP